MPKGAGRGGGSNATNSPSHAAEAGAPAFALSDNQSGLAALLQGQQAQAAAFSELATQLNAQASASPARSGAPLRDEVPERPASVASEASTASTSPGDTLSEAVGHAADPQFFHDDKRRFLAPRWQVSLYGPRAPGRQHHLSAHETEHINLFSGMQRGWARTVAMAQARLAEAEDSALQRLAQEMADEYFAMEPAMQLFITEKTFLLSYPRAQVDPVMEALRSNMEVADTSTSHVEGIPLALPDAGRTLAEFKTKEASEVLRRFGTKAPATPAAKAAAENSDAADLRRKLKTLQDTHAAVKRDLLKAVPDWKPPAPKTGKDGAAKAPKAAKKGAQAGAPPPEGGGDP